MRNWNLNKGYKIYFNLHKRCYSVQAWDQDKRGWRLFKHSHALLVKGAKMLVNETGRQRVIREKRKNVHAFIYPTHIEDYKKGATPRFKKVCTYNPYKAGYFRDKESEQPVHSLDEAVLRYGVVWY